MGWTRTGDRDRDGDRDRVRDRDRNHFVALKQPDPGHRTPDSGRRTGSDTATVAVTATETGWMEPVTGVPAVPFSGDYPVTRLSRIWKDSQRIPEPLIAVSTMISDC